MAREQGLSLIGPDGLLKQLTKTVVETALNEEITGHLGYEKNDPAGQGQGGGNDVTDVTALRVPTDAQARRSDPRISTEKWQVIARTPDRNPVS